MDRKPDSTKPTLGVFTTQDFSVSEGGQSTFIQNVDPYLHLHYRLRYVYLPEILARRNIVPDRLLYAVFLLGYLSLIRFRLDVALSHTFEASWLLSCFGIPYVHINHGNSNPLAISKFSYGRFFAPLYDRILKRILRTANTCLTVGEPYRGMRPIMNPVRIPAGVTPQQDRRGIVFAGRLERVKNVDRLLRIYALLPIMQRKQHPFLILGRGTQERKLKALASRLGLEECVCFLGFRRNEEAFSVYASSALLLMASTIEGFPMVAAECLSVGTPVVSSAVGSLDSVIRSGKNGFLLSPSDPDRSYRDAIQAILSKQRRYSEHALASASIFSAECVASELVRQIENLPLAGKRD